MGDFMAGTTKIRTLGRLVAGLPGSRRILNLGSLDELRRQFLRGNCPESDRAERDTGRL